MVMEMNKTLSYVCGECGKTTAVSISTESPNGFLNPAQCSLITINSCEHCGRISYLRIDAPEIQIPGTRGGIVCYPGESFLNYRLEIVEQYPHPIKLPPKETPKEIASTYINAQKCLGAGSSEGCAILCRRTIEISTKMEGASKSRLVDSIDELGKMGKLSGDLVKLAHGIRILGNDGAHFSGPAFSSITKTDAELALNFVDAFLGGLYHIPTLAILAEQEKMKRKVSSP